MSDIFSDALRQVLDEHCTPQHVRDIECGADSAELWRLIEESGFPNTLMPEHSGGAGLRLRDAFPLMKLAGTYALPLPLSFTMMMRAALAADGKPVPTGPITLAANPIHISENRTTCDAVPYGLVTNWVVVPTMDGATLLDAREAERVATGVHNSLDADLSWGGSHATIKFELRGEHLAIGAVVYAAQLAGAMEAVLARTIGYANERTQFGKSIGKFQAIQQQISIMAEEVYAAHMAAEIGCSSATHLPDKMLAAVAKSRASEAASTASSVSHAVHGAIGITEEYDLQIHTRRLHEWKTGFGSESYWNQQMGSKLLGGEDNLLSFIRKEIFLWDDDTPEGLARVSVLT